MLRTIHNNKKSIGVFLIAGVAALVMTGFGLDFLRAGGGADGRHAISVGDEHVSFSDFDKRRRQTEMQYRQAFGKNYDQYSKAAGLNIVGETRDRLVNELAVRGAAQSMDFVSGSEEVSRFIRDNLFQQNFNPAMYEGMLRQAGMSARDFEREISQQLLAEQYTGLLTDVSFATTREARAKLERDETVYSVGYVEFDPDTYKKDVAAPSDEDLKKLYDANAAEYEMPAQVSYEYAVFDPAQLSDVVEVPQEDVELYYTDNQSKYVTPEELRIQHVQLNFSKDSSPDKINEAKLKAQEIHAKAYAGEDFSGLALQYSDDVTTKFKGGDMGWHKKGELEKEIDSAAWKVKSGGIADLVETSYGFHIVKVSEHKESKPRELEEVKAEIEKEIRTREAPAYVFALAHEKFSAWEKSDASLADAVKENNVQAKSSSGPLSADQDPDPSVAGLSAKILAEGDSKKQIIELGDKAVLVLVTERKEAKIPELAEVKDRLVELHKDSAAKVIAREKANAFLEKVKSGAFPEIAKAEKLAVKTQKDLKQGKSEAGLFGAVEVRDWVFASSAVGAVSDKAFDINDKFYVVQVDGITPPNAEDISKKLVTYESEASQALANTMVESMLRRLKARTVVEVDPSLAAGGA